jgi:hypothetical protein
MSASAHSVANGFGADVFSANLAPLPALALTIALAVNATCVPGMDQMRSFPVNARGQPIRAFGHPGRRVRSGRPCGESTIAAALPIGNPAQAVRKWLGKPQDTSNSRVRNVSCEHPIQLGFIHFLSTKIAGKTKKQPTSPLFGSYRQPLRGIFQIFRPIFNIRIGTNANK